MVPSSSESNATFKVKGSCGVVLESVNHGEVDLRKVVDFEMSDDGVFREFGHGGFEGEDGVVAGHSRQGLGFSVHLDCRGSFHSFKLKKSDTV